MLRALEFEIEHSGVSIFGIARAGLRIVLGLCYVTSAPGFAQDQEKEPGPTLVRGAFSIESSLGFEALNNSNIFESATDIQSSPIWKLAPKLLMRFEPARSRLELGYVGDYAWYERSSNDDYTDHDLEAGAYLLLGERSGLDVLASYEDAHEDRGTELTEGYPPTSAAFPQYPDRYTTEKFLGRYTYGVSQTRNFLTLEGGTEALTYKNNRARTQQFDLDETYGQATFGHRVRPKTSLELRIRVRDIQYDYSRPSGLGLDSQENRYLIGVVWEATTKTTGSVLIGHAEKKFDDPARPDFSGPNWEVAIRWSPRTYSHFDLSTERYTEEPIDILADVTDTAIYSLGWSHEWTSRMESKIAASKVYETFRYVTGDRKDESLQYGAALIYRMRPWLRWEAGVDINARDSNFAPYNFDQTIARLGAWVTF